MEGTDWKSAKAEVLTALKEGTEGLLEGAAEDINDYLADIAQDIIRAKAGGSKVDDEHLEAQLLILAAINKVRIKKTANDTLRRVVSTAQSLAFGFLNAGIGGILS